jgi:molybdopterin molybdotransferase
VTTLKRDYARAAVLPDAGTTLGLISAWIAACAGSALLPNPARTGSAGMAPLTREIWHDVRRSGFARHVELEVASVRLAAIQPRPAVERVALTDALGRVTAAAALAPRDLPPVPQARIDGYALAAAATFGASPYNPLELASGVTPIAAGEPMPPGTDAVLAFSATSLDSSILEVAAPVPPGDGVEAVGSSWRRGAAIVQAGRKLSALEVAQATLAGIAELDVFRRPGVPILASGAKTGTLSADPLILMLRDLLARDGALPRTIAVMDGIAAALRDVGPADLVLVAGRSGCGADDDAAPTLAALGRVVVHGIAIAPGGSAGLGLLGDASVVLLPGEPLACLAAYELLAGPAIRSLAGLDPALPQRRRRRRLGAKIASQVGTTELWLVRADMTPIAPPDRATFAATAEAIGFVLVPPDSEGHPAGAEVEVYLFDGRDG